MKFKNYCVIIMGHTDGAVKEIEKISDSKPNILDAKGIIIATFTSFVDVKELSAWFMMNNRSFMVFDLDPNSSGVHITKPEVHEGLFGFLNQLNKNKLDSRTVEFLKTMQINQKVEGVVTENEKEVARPLLTQSDIEKMSEKEKEDLMNQIMDNGLDNLTEYDKKILPLLAK